MPRISVVVPIYNVEAYLRECLDSLAAQTLEDIEVVMVDDGSTDGSAAIARSYADADPRFKLVSQENGGLSAARNTGIEAATGDYLAFVDSDDLVAPTAYELLVSTLDRTGSDLASGNARRLLPTRTRQVGFLARPMARTRLKTHITKQRTLLTDRTAWNKVWRRSFWDEHGLRFPVGRTYEDIPVVLPLHFAAKSVDVLSDVIYYWRTREGENLSITQRRNQPKELDNRIQAIQDVSDYLATHGLRKAKGWYDTSVVEQDLKYFLNALDSADDDYRAYFLQRVNEFLDSVSPRAFRPLPAIDRLKWLLVRRRMLPELLEIRRFELEDLQDAPPVRIRGRWYADHPYRTDRSLRIPRSLFRIDKDLDFTPWIDSLRWEDGALQIDGAAYVAAIGAPDPRSQRVTVIALRPGRLQSVRLRVAHIRTRAENVRRDEQSPGGNVANAPWAGFTAALPARRLRSAGRWRDGRWDLYIAIKVGRLRRYRSRFRIDRARPPRVAHHLVPDGPQIAVEPTDNGEVALHVRSRWATLTGQRADGDAVEVTGELSGPEGKALQLEASRRDADGRHRAPVSVGKERPRPRFSARVALAGLRETAPDPWDLSIGGLTLTADATAAVALDEREEVALTRALDGRPALVVRPPGATVDAARWTEDGRLELAGEIRMPGGPHELVLEGRNTLRSYAVPAPAEGGRFSAALTPSEVPTLDGELPLAEDTWEVRVRRAGEPDSEPVRMADALYEQLPLVLVAHHKPFRFGMNPDGDAVLIVRPNLDPDERGRRRQRRLRSTVYRPGREEPLRDTVVYTSFRGRQYSDNPRAIHEELVRRDAPLEHLWVVGDNACRVPPTATPVRAGSRDHYDALAHARFVVDNDHFPDWFERRPDQLCLQTWHGTPLKRLGFDVSQTGNAPRRFERNWERQERNWQYVLSPNRFTTPILRRAYELTGELLETGYPRNDLLARADRAVHGARIRERLGLPESARVVLYAPTYRDHVRDLQARYRLEPALDVERLRAAVGPDTVVLFRKHHYVVDPVPATPDGFVRDVSTYPDATELLLAADVLVTDYSSMMFDFANTGRPMLFFTYDLERYRDEIRGFYFDFAAEAPGPLLQTTDELAAALQDLDAVTAAHADRYREFASTFCELDDGRAAERVVDRLLGVGKAVAAGATRERSRPSA